MPDFTRIATFKYSVNPTYGMVVEWPGGSAAVLWSFINANTEEQLTAYLQASSGRDDIWVHKNDDGSVAIAIGEVPPVWPEDEDVAPPESHRYQLFAHANMFVTTADEAELTV